MVQYPGWTTSSLEFTTESPVNLGIPTPAARRLIAAYQMAYLTCWKWRSAIVDEVICGGTLATRYGWIRKSKTKDTANSIANFAVQAASGEILRAAVIALEEAGHCVVAPVHDALMAEMDVTGWRQELAEARYIMEEAAKIVTDRLSIPTNVDSSDSSCWIHRSEIQNHTSDYSYSIIFITMKNTPTENSPSLSTPRFPSWVAERDALCFFGDPRNETTSWMMSIIEGALDSCNFCIKAKSDWRNFSCANILHLINCW